MKQRLGIIVEFGFHDLKKYIYSGFGSKLGEHFNIVWLAIQKNSEEFDRLFRETGYPIIYFDKDDFKVSGKTENHNTSVRRAWMNRKNLGQFHNYKTIEPGFLRSFVLGNELIKRYYENKTLNLIEKKYYNQEISTFIEKHKIDILLGTGYSSAFSKSVFITGNRKKLPCFLLINNWKDIYVNNFIPFRFLAGLFVWDEKMKNDCLIHMPYLEPDKLIISGNPVFDFLKTSVPLHDRQFYARKYKIDPNADWLYYTMMSPLAGTNEIDTVIAVGEALQKKCKKEEKVILLRRNPQHNVTDFTDIKLPDNVVLTDHYSYFDKIKDMHTQSPEGEQEWIDLLHHCCLNLSVPSTVTLEFLTLNKPVINIGFDHNGIPDKRLKQHFEAGFYRPMFDNSLVKKAMHIDDAVELILNDHLEDNLLKEKELNMIFASDLLIQAIK